MWLAAPAQSWRVRPNPHPGCMAREVPDAVAGHASELWVVSAYRVAGVRLLDTQHVLVAAAAVLLTKICLITVCAAT